jgi:hypothetical protein
MTISNFELVALAKQYHLDLKLKDIMLIDELKEVRCRKKMNLILNYQANGSAHFVCLAVRGGDALYMDSFGGYPLLEVVEYCELHKLRLGYNGVGIQPSSSSNCGVYCFAFLMFLQNSKNVYDVGDDFVSLFDGKHVDGNDDVLHELLSGIGVRHDYK